MAKDESQDTKGKDEKQVPVKPKKLGGGELSFVKILIIIAVTIVLIFGLFITAWVFVISPDLQPTVAVSDSTQVENGDAHGDEHGKKDDHHDEDHEMSEEEEFLAEDDHGLFETTGRITTNPRGSTKFVVVDLGLEFVEKKAHGEEEEESGGGGHGGGGGGHESHFEPKALAKIKGGVTSLIGSMPLQELQTIERDTLRSLLKKRLKPIMKKEKMFLRNVILQEFIIQ
jgi:flagellar basal body-associated protein FliL